MRVSDVSGGCGSVSSTALRPGHAKLGFGKALGLRVWNVPDFGAQILSTRLKKQADIWNEERHKGKRSDGLEL